jgi:L-lactate dehydrogenase
MMDAIDGGAPVALSMPRIVGAKGIEKTLQPRLNAKEQGLLERSANVLRVTVGRVSPD